MLKRLILAVAVGGGLSAPALATEPSLERALAACLAAIEASSHRQATTPPPEGAVAPEAYLRRQSGGGAARREHCVGYAAEICIAADEDGSSTLGTADCVRREARVWEARLNDAYKTLLSRTSGRTRDSYRRAERAWITYRDATCAVAAARLGTHDRVVPVTTNCLLDLTARQALWLDGELDEISTTR